MDTTIPLAVPLIDLSPSATSEGLTGVVEAVRAACESVGFLVVVGHGVPPEVIADLDREARAFFALPYDEKMHTSSEGGVYRGFMPSKASALALSRDVVTLPDLCELYTINRFDDPDTARRAGLREGREGFFAPNVWPERPEGFRAAFERYYGEMELLAGRLMSLMALALDLPADWFDDKIADHITNLTVNYYAATDGPTPEGQFRRGEHTDWGSLTILRHDGQPGLEIFLDGRWTAVPTVPDSFVINLGDLMAAWTNDRWVSTLHRVVAPVGESGDRMSVAFFHQPTYDALIECIPTCTSADDPPHHAPMTSGEWIAEMLRKTIY